MSTNTPSSGTDDRSGDDGANSHDALLSYLRGELSAGQMRELALRLTESPALREELALLRAAAQLAQDDYVDHTADAAFERFQAALDGRQAAQTAYGHTYRDTSRAPSGARSPATPDGREPSLVARLQAWLRSHAPALQPVLLTLIVAQAGVLGYFIHDRNDVRMTQEVPAATRGAAGSCLDVWVTPAADADVKGMRDWLLQYGGSIVAGPDSQGRFRITLPDAETLAAFTHDPVRARLTQSVENAVQCDGGAASAP